MRAALEISAIASYPRNTRDAVGTPAGIARNSTERRGSMLTVDNGYKKTESFLAPPRNCFVRAWHLIRGLFCYRPKTLLPLTAEDTRRCEQYRTAMHASVQAIVAPGSDRHSAFNNAFDRYFSDSVLELRTEKPSRSPLRVFRDASAHAFEAASTAIYFHKIEEAIATNDFSDHDNVIEGQWPEIRNGRDGRLLAAMGLKPDAFDSAWQIWNAMSDTERMRDETFREALGGPCVDAMLQIYMPEPDTSLEEEIFQERDSLRKNLLAAFCKVHRKDDFIRDNGNPFPVLMGECFEYMPQRIKKVIEKKWKQAEKKKHSRVKHL
jgi:hypothetical protein